MPTVRLELTRLSPLPPQDSVFTNFTTSAFDQWFRQVACDRATVSYGDEKRNYTFFLRRNITYFGISLAFESASAVGLAGACSTGSVGWFWTRSMTLVGACVRLVAR